MKKKAKEENDNSFIIVEDETDRLLYEGRPMTEDEKEQRKEEVKDFGGYEDK